MQKEITDYPVKKVAVKGITESGTTVIESYVYLQSANLSKGTPTATIRFDCKFKSDVIKNHRNGQREIQSL